MTHESHSSGALCTTCRQQYQHSLTSVVQMARVFSFTHCLLLFMLLGGRQGETLSYCYHRHEHFLPPIGMNLFPCPGWNVTMQRTLPWDSAAGGYLMAVVCSYCICWLRKNDRKVRLSHASYKRILRLSCITQKVE